MKYPKISIKEIKAIDRSLTDQEEDQYGMIDIPDPRNEDRYESAKNKAEQGGFEFCPCCGKAISTSNLYIFSAYGGCAYKYDNKALYSDCWLMPIGSECAKRFPKGYIFELTTNFVRTKKR